MNIGLLTIDNILPVNSRAADLPSKPSETGEGGQSAKISDNGSSAADSPQTVTTDNISADAQNKPVKDSSEDFGDTLKKTISSTKSPETNGGTESKGQNTVSSTETKPNLTKAQLTQDSPVDIDPKADNIAQLLATVGVKSKTTLSLTTQKTSKLASSPNQGPNLTPANPAKMVPAASTPKKNLQTTLDKNQLKIETKSVLSGISKATIPVDAQLEQNKTETLHKPVVGEGGLTKQKNPTELLSKVPPDGGKETTYSEKDLNKQGGAEVLITKVSADGSKETNHSEKNLLPTASDGQKTFSAKPALQITQTKSSQLRSQVTEPGSRKPAVNSKIPTDNNTDTGKDGQSGEQKGPRSFENGAEQNANLSDNNILQKLNPVQVQMSGSQTNTQKKNASGTSSDSNTGRSGQTVSLDNTPSTIAEQPVSVSAPKSLGNNSTGNADTSITNQIQESIYSSLRQGDKQVTIRLNPPELGRVSIKFQQQQDRITGLLEVSKAQTRYEIERAIPQIIRNLQNMGIQIKRVEVVLSEQSQQHTFKDQALTADQRNWQGPGDSDNQAAPKDNTSNNEWSINDNIYTSFNEHREMFVTNSSINILI